MKRSPLVLLLLITAILGFSGCASPTQSSAMQSEILTIKKKHSQTVEVQVGGGLPTNPMWTSQIANEDLLRAIKESILKNQLFSSVVAIGSSEYLLNATIVNLKQPLMGFNMTVGIEIIWTLTPKGTDKPIWEKSIQTESTKGVGDAFAGIKRLRITTEAAAKENISQAIMQIGSLDLK
jgi:hypothetical protein